MKLLNCISVILFFCASSYLLGAQKTYVWNSSGKLDMPSYYEMYEFDIQTGDRQLLFRLDSIRFAHPNMTGNTFQIISFAFSSKSKTIYFLEKEGDLYTYEIANDLVTYIKDLTPGNLNFLWHNYHQTNQIDQLNDSLYYIGGATKGILNVNNFQYYVIREIPSFAASGTNFERLMYIRKLEKHKDKYLMIDGNVYLAYADLYDPLKNKIAINQDLSPLGYFDDTNLLSYQYTCDSTVLYTLQNKFYMGQRDTIQIDRVDLVTGQVTRWKNYIGLSSSNFSTNRIRDAQHFNANTWESCQRYIDLDKDDNTASNKDFLIDSLCTYSHLPLSDLDILIHNEYPIDSIDVFILDPRFSQYLYFPNGNFILKSTPNYWQRIINNGTTNTEDFENAIRNAYLDIDNDPSATEIKIGFHVWYNGIKGDTAIATIQIAGPLPQAGEDVIKAYCDGDTTLTLQNLPSESADQGGHFYDENFNNITKLGPISPPYDGTLYYQTSNGICFDTAQINLTVRPNPTINEIADISLCSNDIYTSNIILQNGQTMTWSDGNTDPIRNISQAGSYSYQITDDFGCTVSDTFTIIKLPPAKSRTTDAQICDGDSYIFMNNEYRIPGIYTDTIKSKIGCDSVFFNLNLNLYPYSPITIADDLDFCEGHHTDIVISSSHDTILLDGIKTLTPLTFTEGGTYMITGTDQNGCTSEKEITITVHPNPQVNTIDMIDTVFSSGLSFPVTYDGDIEAYHWSPSTSLDCNDCPYPTLLYPQAGIYTIAIEDNNGCKNEAQLKVSFLEKKLFLPNIISNNATDPENGYFYVKGNNTSLYTMSVYDRWGNLVFYTKDAQVNQRDQGWHPQAKVVSGVYVYLVRYVENGVEKIEYGNVTVLD